MNLLYQKLKAQAMLISHRLRDVGGNYPKLKTVAQKVLNETKNLSSQAVTQKLAMELGDVYWLDDSNMHEYIKTAFNLTDFQIMYLTLNSTAQNIDEELKIRVDLHKLMHSFSCIPIWKEDIDEHSKEELLWALRVKVELEKEDPTVRIKNVSDAFKQTHVSSDKDKSDKQI